MADLKFTFGLDDKINPQISKKLDDIDKKLGRARDSTGRFTSSTDKLAAAGGKAADSHKKQSDSALHLGKSLESARKEANTFLETLGALAVWDGIKAMTSAVMDLGTEIISAAGKAERLESVIKMTAGDKAGGQLLHWLEGITKHTEFTDDQLKGFASDLLHVGMSADKAKMALAAALDIAAGMKDKLPAMAGAINAFEKLERTGKVDNRTLAPLGFGEKDFRRLDRFKNMSKEALSKALEGGKVGQDELFQLIMGRTGHKTIGTAGVAMSKSLDAQMTHLKDLPDQFFQSMSKGQAFQDFKTVISKVLEVFDPDSPKGQKIAAGMERSAKAFVDVLAKVDIEKAAASILQLFEKLPGVIEVSTKAAIRLLDVLMKVADKFAGLVGGPASMKPVTKAELRTKADGTQGGFLTELNNVFGVAWNRMFGIGGAAADGLSKGMEKGAPNVEASGVMLGDAASFGTGEALKIRSPSKVYEHMGLMSGQGFKLGLEKSGVDNVMPGAFAVPAPSGGAVARAPITVEVAFTMNVNGSEHQSGAQLANDVAANLREILPGALQSAFEQMQIEAGA